MKKWIVSCICLLLMTGCATTQSRINDITSNYEAPILAVNNEEMHNQVVEYCSELAYKDRIIRMKCELVSEVIVYKIKLNSNRREWSPQAAADITEYLVTDVCNNPFINEVMQVGFGIMIDLQGPNGFPGKVKNYDDCNTQENVKNS